jgi:hypothetical protein
MEDEYKSLMRSLGVPHSDTDADSLTSPEPNKSLLNVEDEDEVLVPTPADASVVPSCSTSEHNQVNDEFMEIVIENNSGDEDLLREGRGT